MKNILKSNKHTPISSNINKIKLMILVILVLFTSIQKSTSQKLSNPLIPSYGYIYPNYVGGFIGFGNNFQNGKYLVDCNGCEFEGGNGLNFIIGINRDWGLEKGLFLNLGLGYESVAINSTFREVEELTDQTYNKTFFAEFRHDGKISLGLVRLMPAIRYNFTKLFFAKAGLNMGYVVSNNITHTQTPVNEFVFVPGTGEVFLETFENERQNGEIENVNKLQFGVNLDIGTQFLIKKKTRVSPSLQYYMPFTDIIDNGLGFNAPTLRFMLEVNFRTNESSGDSMVDTE